MPEETKLFKVVQSFPRPRIGGKRKIQRAVRAEIEKLIRKHGSLHGLKIGVLVGSRGIASIDVVVKEAIRCFKFAGANVIIIPAMGSHGEGIAEKQTAVLATLGVTEQLMGAPIDARMETTLIGQAPLIASDDERLIELIPVNVAQSVLDVDFVFPINRVKLHTEFDGKKLASGLQKMLAIGIAKLSAKIYHSVANRLGPSDEEPLFEPVISAVATLVRGTGKVFGGLALVENAYHELMLIRATSSDEMPRIEAECLEVARQYFPRLPRELFDADVLVVRWVGKFVSGYGADSNITGRGIHPSHERPNFARVVYIELDDDSYGNALGAGLADFVSQRLWGKVNPVATAKNVESTGRPMLGRRPKFIGATDRETLEAAFEGLRPNPKIVFIQTTLRMSEFYVSESAADELRAAGYKVGPATNFTFDEGGWLTGPDSW